jgi:hypothetical protein
MSDGPPEKRQGFERWVASLKLGAPMRPPSSPPPAAEDADGSPLTLDEQATLINRIPKEVIYKLRERDSQRAGMGLPKNDDSTAVFTPPPELLARAKRFEAPPKPERSSPVSSTSPTSRPPPITSPSPKAPGLSAAEAAAYANLNSEEEATTLFRPEVPDVPSSLPPALQGDLSRPGDIQWIDGLASSPPPPGPVYQSGPAGVSPAYHSPAPAAPGSLESVAPLESIAPSERRLRWIAVVVALLLLAGIFVLSRMQ